MNELSFQSVKNDVLDALNWQESVAFECYGVKINFRADRAGIINRLKNFLPRVVKIDDFENSNNVLSLSIEQNSAVRGLYFNDELIMEIREYDPASLEFVADKITMILAQISLPKKFYLHAGAVVWNGLGILMPGESFAGKTTLVKEFIKAGADYYTDDCIVLDNEGFLLPFPRPLAIRTDEGRIHREADHFGAKTGDRKKKLDLILFTNFEENAVWQPKKLSQGNGVLGLMDNFYYRGSVGNEPAEIIKALTGITKEIQMFGGKRGEAGEVVGWFSENFIHLTKM